METRVHKLAHLTQEDVEQTLLTTRAYMARHRGAILQALEGMGFSEVEFTRHTAKRPHQPEILAMKDGREASICFAPIPEQPLALDALSEEQCDYCNEHYAESDVYYACLLVNPQSLHLHMLGPAPVKLEGVWQMREPETCQFIPLSQRKRLDRYSPIYGGAVLFKMDKLFIPHVLEHGTLPRFSVENLFTDQEQGENGFYALMSGQAPTHLMLVHKEGEETRFLRPFFYGDGRPVSELELMRCLDEQPDCGVLELIDKTGRVLYAECLEAVLFPSRLTTSKHYMWTLSLVATDVRDAGDAEPAFYQEEPRHTDTQLSGSITHIKETMIDGQVAYVWTLRPLSHNPEVEVQVYVGEPLLSARGRARAKVGDVVEVEGFLYASPDELVESAESWQDSGAVAVMQETHQLETQGRYALRGHAPYSLAHAAVASVFAGAGYADIVERVDHTRQYPSFVMRHEQGYIALLFLDVEIGESSAQFAYTEEQIQQCLAREKERFGTALHAHRCIVRLDRQGARFTVHVKVEPECPGVPSAVELPDLVVPSAEKSVDEAQACRLLCNAICWQFWGAFAAVAHEDLSYTSMVNGTKVVGKVEYMRYMAERKPLWESQQAWQGITIDTGTIEYVGVRRPCFMISCYGRMVGASVVTLHEGKVADIVTLPLEANETFVRDAECAAEPSIFHPMRGHVYAYSEAPTPLQRFALAYLQDCMIRKIGFCAANGSQESVYITNGEERRFDTVGARWVKQLRHAPSFCDMAFTCAGRLYAVCAIEVPKHPENGGDIRQIIEEMGAVREKALRMAEKYRLVPCVFPVQRDHSPHPSKTWNLWDLRTIEPVTPTMETGEEEAPISEWEVLQGALFEISKFLRFSGCELVSCHDTPDLLPHVWFLDPHRQLSWMIIRPHTSVAYADCGVSEAELRALKLTQDGHGYVVEAEPYQDHSHTKPAMTRDQLRFVKFTAPVSLG